MNDGLIKFREGTTLAPQLTVKAWNAMVDAIRRNWIRPGPNTLMNQDVGGTQLWGTGRGGNRRAPTVLTPFQPLDLSASGALKVGFYYGTVNFVIPTLGGAPLDITSPPSVTITATTYFWLKCVGTFGAPDSYVVTIEYNTTGTVPGGEAISATNFTSYLPLARADVASGTMTISRFVFDDLGVESYGSVNFWW